MCNSPSRGAHRENIGHHFVVDPTKFDFYAMDCYRQLAEDKMAGHLAEEVLRASTDFDGAERAPMRNTEARVSLGVIAARPLQGESPGHHGRCLRLCHDAGVPTHVALLRGVNNLGGKKVAMTELRELVTSLGHADVMTYIQSGNVLPPVDDGVNSTFPLWM